jgi:hypothetical protein
LHTLPLFSSTIDIHLYLAFNSSRPNMDPVGRTWCHCLTSAVPRVTVEHIISLCQASLKANTIRTPMIVSIFFSAMNLTYPSLQFPYTVCTITYRRKNHMVMDRKIYRPYLYTVLRHMAITVYGTVQSPTG